MLQEQDPHRRLCPHYGSVQRHPVSRDRCHSVFLHVSHHEPWSSTVWGLMLGCCCQGASLGREVSHGDLPTSPVQEGE